MQLWDIEAYPELSIKGRFQRDENGDEVWVVVAKRTWQFDGEVWHELGDSEIFDDPQYLGEEGFSAMKVDQEFAYTKNNTDVLVYGKARSYAKKPVTYQECRVLIDGHIDKTLAVHGERVWVEHGGSVTLSKPVPFIEKDIDYTCAIGGDLRNRIGGGVADSNKELLEQKVPSVFYPKEEWSSTSKNLRVAGFGPVPPFFEARQTLAGTFDEEWIENRKPMLPLDFDRRFFQSAPADQQCKGFLKGGERLMMSGFCHDDTISFRIPKEKYRAIATFKDGSYPVDMAMYTLFVDAEKKTISISYTAAFPCQSKEHLLVSTSIMKVEEVSEHA
ncbi:DUF2169 domain-containing protein [Vibrio parahaemolyticus]|uniref:DUF2169 family type VI secretion system accessory protein n=1 Tax=Vibrio parahaemolyticus TaxID=670 RepID=UPI001DE24DA1|nr:DUF2169 domain-containing protein [Vibrio parahaemolyticus]EGR1383844.1 DUF2169 domain-containing protein [Vibrio parahaemolyticus]EHH2554123.1 DUF2169 domain-containing protein [Vibrio parahaemolyticus]EHR0801883.1 DUF2169 domain-containing protein [Vibrio parahaemolyticus]EJS4018332.1 DUF2169 domain-containing protein [Vibrio parahaemolyticus]